MVLVPARCRPGELQKVSRRTAVHRVRDNWLLSGTFPLPPSSDDEIFWYVPPAVQSQNFPGTPPVLGRGSGTGAPGCQEVIDDHCCSQVMREQEC